MRKKLDNITNSADFSKLSPEEQAFVRKVQEEYQEAFEKHENSVKEYNENLKKYEDEVAENRLLKKLLEEKNIAEKKTSEQLDISPNSTTKQINSSAAIPHSQNSARVQFSTKTTFKKNISKQNENNSKEESSEIAEERKSTQVLNNFIKLEQEWEIELQEILEKLRNNSINEIDLRNRKLDVNGVKVLASALKENHSLTTIDLSWTSISDESIAALVEALKENRSLTSISLTHNYIGTTGTKALAEVLKVNRSLTAIDLMKNNIGDEEAATLAEALKKNRSLMTVNLALNKICNKGATALAEVLKVNHSLTTFDLMSNDIGNEGTAALAEALKENHSLLTMDLSYDNISAEGTKALVEALKENHSLIMITLSGNKIGTEQKKIIKNYLDRNIALRDQLHRAVQVGDLKKIEEYIQGGAGLLSTTGAEENTPLHWAAAKGHIAIVKLLMLEMLTKKLNLAAKNKDNQTPLDLAKKNGHEEVIQLLQEEKVSVGNLQTPINVQTVHITTVSKDISSSETERYIQRGEKFLLNEEYSEALQCFEKVLKSQPEHAEVLLRKGTTLLKFTRLDEAKQVFEKVIAIKDKNAEKYQQLAKKYLQKVEKKQALQQSVPAGNTDREELLGRIGRAGLRKPNIKLNSETKQTKTINPSAAIPLSRNPARVQFSAKTTLIQISDGASNVKALISPQIDGSWQQFFNSTTSTSQNLEEKSAPSKPLSKELAMRDNKVNKKNLQYGINIELTDPDKETVPRQEKGLS